MPCWHNGRSFLVAVLVALALAGCQPVTPKPEPVLQRATAEQLASMLRARAEATQSAKGLFRAQIRGPGLLLPARVDGAVFYSRPDAMRVRGFNFLAGELFELVVNHDLYRLRLPTEGRELKGQASELGQIAKFGRPVQLSLWAVYGALGLTTVGPDEQLTLSEDGDRYRLDVRGAPDSPSADVMRRIWFDRKSLLMVQEDWVGPTGQVEAVMRYEDYRSEPEVVPASASSGTGAPALRAYRIVMEDGRGRGSVRLTFQEIVANVPIRPEELGTI